MRVFFTNLGCKLNQAENERLARDFLAAGHQVVASLGDADLHVVNSCTVTAAAARSSRPGRPRRGAPCAGRGAAHGADRLLRHRLAGRGGRPCRRRPGGAEPRQGAPARVGRPGLSGCGAGEPGARGKHDRPPGRVRRRAPPAPSAPSALSAPSAPSSWQHPRAGQDRGRMRHAMRLLHHPGDPRPPAQPSPGGGDRGGAPADRRRVSRDRPHRGADLRLSCLRCRHASGMGKPLRASPRPGPPGARSARGPASRDAPASHLDRALGAGRRAARAVVRPPALPAPPPLSAERRRRDATPHAAALHGRPLRPPGSLAWR